MLLAPAKIFSTSSSIRIILYLSKQFKIIYYVPNKKNFPTVTFEKLSTLQAAKILSKLAQLLLLNLFRFKHKISVNIKTNNNYSKIFTTI